MPTKRRDLRLPQELIDAVVLELRDDSACLAACSKTAKTFRVPCQRLIFREMVIHSEESGYPNTYRRASDLLTSSPHLEAQVLNISTAWPTEENDMHAFEAVLRLLRSVQRLVISNTGFVSWRTYPALNAAMFDFISLPSLDRLHLIKMDEVPSSLIYHAASSVRVLSLEIYLDQTNVSEPPVEPSPSSPQLEHFILSSRPTFYLSTFVSRLSRGGYLRNTRRLTLSLEERQEGYQNLFDSLPLSLRHLEIDYGLFRGIMSIPKLESLQVLELNLYIGMTRSLPSNLDRIVTKLPELTPLLERLTLTFRTMPRIPEIPWSTQDGSWPVFDVGFLERRELPRLCKVTCCLQLTMDYFHGDSDVSYTGFVTALERKLPGLRGTDMLIFTQKNSSYRYQDHLP
ncbi:hypothetical protein MVEN_02005200 [Mycena venus]|uniref:Uncharacterized protein n=1 Tax=Mycena venus TaxID=2733690 RepID=A0A8H6XB52_9AGAR|nr:hypothetical protein MVEN_02005200 [Mycena venus]